MVLRSAFGYLASRMRFIILVSELKGVLYYNSANTLFFVESMLRHDGGIVPVNGHISAMDGNAKGSDSITTNNHIILVDARIKFV